MRSRGVLNLCLRSVELGRKYVHRFGPFRGPYILMNTYILMNIISRRGLATLSLPDYPNPFYMRRGTTDRGIFTQVIVDEEYDLSFLLPNWQPEVIVDAGANVGYASLFFARRYPKARIFAIEPELSNFSLLEQNVRGYDAIIPVRAALWSRKAHLKIGNPEEQKCDFRVNESSDGGESGIPAVTVRDLLEMSNKKHIDLLKLDIEGGEKDLFEHGTENWLDDISVIAIELHDRFRPGCRSAVFQATDRHCFCRTDRNETTFLMRANSDLQ
jgi:FkbM family methyltransferase